MLRIEARFDEADQGLRCFRAKPVGRPLAIGGKGRGRLDGDFDFAKPRGERCHLLGELQTSTVKIADVAGEAFDVGQVMRGDEDGGLASAR